MPCFSPYICLLVDNNVVCCHGSRHTGHTPYVQARNNVLCSGDVICLVECKAIQVKHDGYQMVLAATVN
jgi:hypothetical protein